MLRLGLVLILLSLSSTSFAKLDTTSPKTHEFVLKNGLKIIVREDHRAPVAVSQIWYRVGSSYEPGGLTGISHALEHMMFKGTPTHPAGTFSRTIALNGGSENAFTNDDYTAYYQEMESARLPIALKLEADRMQHLSLPALEFKKEIEVVKEERRMRMEDNPQALTYERFNAAAHITNPYHHMTIGWMDDLNHMTVDDLRHWYQTWYAPNNAILVVVGDVKAKEVFATAEKYFGAIPQRPLPTIKPQQIPASISKQRIQVWAKANLPVLYMGYNVPSRRTAEKTADAYALEVISGVLDAGESSRLSRDMVRKQGLAVAISANYDLYSRFDGLFVFEAVPANNVSVRTLEKGLQKQIEQLKTQLVPQQELDRIKAQIVAKKVFSRDSLIGQAMQIGMLEVVGLSWQESDKYMQEIDAVTPEQIREVAKKYFTKKRLTIAELVPEALSENKNSQPLPTSMGDRHVH